MTNNIRYLLLIALTGLLSSPVSVYGFGDFSFDNINYENPSADIAYLLGGEIVPVHWSSVESLILNGPAIGIGLDPTARRAYVNGTAFGAQSLAVSGPDAGTYTCGHLYKRLLIEHPCSAFVHIPQFPGPYAIGLIEYARFRSMLCSIQVHP